MEDVRITLPRATLYTILGKLSVVLILGVGFGYYLAIDSAADVKRGKAMTLATYTADYEEYRDGLTSKETSIPLTIAVCLVLVGATFSAYDVLGYGMARFIRRLDGELRPSAQSEPSP